MTTYLTPPRGKTSGIVLEYMFDKINFCNTHIHFMYSQVKPETAGTESPFRVKFFITNKHLCKKDEYNSDQEVEYCFFLHMNEKHVNF